jgi:hypothetical protein
MSELKNCQSCGQLRYQQGKGSHVYASQNEVCAETRTPVQVTYTREQVMTAIQETENRMAFTDSVDLDKMMAEVRESLTGDQFTFEQVLGVLNAAADDNGGDSDRWEYETSDTIWVQDTVNLAVNTASYLLDHPGAGFDEIIPAQYEFTEPDFYDYDVVPEKGSPEWNEAVARTVLGWVR